MRIETACHALLWDEIAPAVGARAPSRLAPVASVLGGQPVQLHVARADGDRQAGGLAAGTCTLAYQLGQAPLRLHLSPALLDTLLSVAGLPGEAAWQAASAASRHTAMAFLLDRLAAQVEAASGESLTPLPMAQAAPAADVHGDLPDGQARFSVTVTGLASAAGPSGPAGAPAPRSTPAQPGGPLLAWLDLPAALGERLSALPALPPDPQAFADLLLSASLQAGWQVLTVAQLMSLAAGDVVLLRAPTHDMRLVVQTRLAAAVRWQEQACVLATPLHPLDAHEGDLSMENAVAAAPHDDVESLAQLPLTLVCEVGQVSLTLAEVRSLQTGSVLPLARGPQQAVDLKVNGRRVGQGELVRIDEQLGVRIVRLAAHD